MATTPPLVFFGVEIARIDCVTTTDPKQIHIVLLQGDIIALPYTTYQTIRVAAGLPDVACGED